MTNTEYLRKHLLEQCGYREKMVSINKLKLSEWSPEFEELMRNRLLMGAFRYGKMRDADNWDRIDSIERRLASYKESRNKEHLVDIANLCLVEFEKGKGHFKALDDTNLTRRKYEG